MAATAPVILDLSLLYGPVLIGNSIAIAFWGAQCTLTIFYFINYTKDPTLVKAWVVLLFGLDTAHTILLIKGIWVPLISQYGNFEAIAGVLPELVYQQSINAVVAFMAQCYFVRRIYIFGSKPIFKYGVPALLAPLIIWQVVGSIIYTARGLSFKEASQLSSLSHIAIGVNSSAAAVDIVTTIAMCTLLYLSRNGLQSTDRLLGWLMISSLNTGAWTALFAIITVILALTTPPEDILYAVTNFPLCALYCTTILGNLTARKYLRNPRGTTTASSITLQPISFRNSMAGNPKINGQVDKSNCLSPIAEDATEHQVKPLARGEYAV
ncbi:hypothetical protein BD410DRAFT_841726 [Rickenella mellea]|uniref:DUF6534 domain-containing protein n=1 Tax=Rickenella mellea TaxID=50990 RepID=A0A4Y7PZA9_9AGAM|nr:hypothetical protein BD410DRAFT_841726 [Rickenella mellea]